MIGLVWAGKGWPILLGSTMYSISINSSYSRSPVKSIFEGATKYDILHYLEDARDRGLTDVELDLEEEEEEDVEEAGEDTKVSRNRI